MSSCSSLSTQVSIAVREHDTALVVDSTGYLLEVRSLASKFSVRQDAPGATVEDFKLLKGSDSGKTRKTSRFFFTTPIYIFHYIDSSGLR